MYLAWLCLHEGSVLGWYFGSNCFHGSPPNVTVAFVGGMSSVAEREVSCYLRDLLTSDGSDLRSGTWRLLEINSGTYESLANRGNSHFSPLYNSTLVLYSMALV